ncbi:AAA-domain-containing protein [Polychaeton citri CBS 116435]|uniref:Vesicular-fusion protein SEC18 n=1 Tax=Polychaeton citri CBS 116435 TaxID=1314669 RepID=A0A9P4Q2V6_9PEZI|nr:AAA-domain-containing protein [Polychaeton citri CBS 116435]
MFDRNNLFGNRGSPQPPRQSIPQREADARYRQSSPYRDEPKGRPQQPQGGGGSRIQLRPAKSPDNSFTFGNLCAVSAQDIPPSHDGQDVYLLLNGAYVLSARPIPQFPRGQISLSDPQRTWMQVALTDVVDVQSYDPFSQGAQSYLGNADVEVGFAGRKTTDVPYDQDELAKAVTQTFRNQILAPGQQILMDFRSIALRLTVRTVELVDIASLKSQGGSSQLTNPQARGILTPETTISFYKDARTPINLKAGNKRTAATSVVRPDFKFEQMGIGGLDDEFAVIFRRAFSSRLISPALAERLGIQHVRGMLLYGPPGTGKTLMARQIGKMLNAREPKVINGPEVLNKYVGQSEENIRKLFADAEKEYKEKGDESGLHIIIFDELDAVCKQRGAGAGGGTGVGDSVVNQLLSKLDGVDQLNNILLIGMTNRKDMIDEALMRPGRLEVHMEISLPDENGRNQILKIHTTKMRDNSSLAADVDLAELARRTENYSGAELSGVIRSATSFAINRHIKAGTQAAISDDIANMKVGMDDFIHALDETKPLYGVNKEDVLRCIEGGVVKYSKHIDRILEQATEYVEQVRRNDTDLMNVLVHGPVGSGKTALAAQMALNSGFPFIRIVQPFEMVGMTDLQKIQFLSKTFTDAYKSPQTLLILDEIELMIEWVNIGPRFSSTVLNAIKAQMTQKPPKGRSLLTIVTSSERSVLHNLGMKFNAEIAVPNVRTQEELYNILASSGQFSKEEAQKSIGDIQQVTGSDRLDFGIKQVLMAIQTAKQNRDKVGSFVDTICGVLANV